MLKFKISNKDYNLKNKWEDISMKDWISIQKLDRNKNLYMDELYTIKVFEALTDATEDELMDLELDTLNKIISNIKFLTEPIPKRNNKKIKVGDIYYMFVGNLNKLTMGEVISIKTFQENVKDEFESMMLMMAILVRPVKVEEGKDVIERFDGATVKSRSEYLLEAKLIDLNHFLVFFFNGNLNSGILATKNSSEVVQEVVVK